ncbi:MAG TPA: hypothetical protein VGL94_02365 [Ktedonobacteraceae bacterium]
MGHPINIVSVKSLHTTTLSDTDPLVAKSLHEASLAMRIAEHPAHEYNENKALMTPSGNPQAEALPKGKLPQQGKPLPTTLWLAFALSGIVLLLGTVVLYALVPLRAPGSTEPAKSSPTPATTPTSPTVQTSLTGSYAEQTNQIYNLTNEGTLDWINWGLNAPGDVNHKRGVLQQISTFTMISSANNNASGTSGIIIRRSGNDGTVVSSGGSSSSGNGNGNIGNGNNNGNYNSIGLNAVQRISYRSNAKL